MKMSPIEAGQSLNRLTVTRKGDRAKMAAAVKAVAESLGATVEVEPEDPAHPYRNREWRLKINVAGGAYLPISITGDSPHRPDPNVFVCTWNTELDSLFAFSGRMGDVNPHHFSKVTRIAHGLEDLLDILRSDIPTLLSGEGYSSERARKLAEGRRQSLRNARDYYAPLVEAGLGTTFQDGSESMSAERVREKFKAIPALLEAVDSFIAAGCPLERCESVPQLSLF